MNSSKKNIILILVIIFFILSAAAFFYFSRSANNLKESPFFVMLDKDIVTSAESKFSPEMKQNFREKIAEADQVIAKAGAVKEDLIAAYGNRALYQTYLGEYENAYNSYLKTLEQNSQSRVLWLALGDLLVKMKGYKTAENAYDKAKNLNAYEPQVYLKLAELYELSAPADREKIKKVFEAGLANIADNTLLLDAYARWSADVGDKAKAIELYQQLLRLQPQNSEALNREIDKLK